MSELRDLAAAYGVAVDYWDWQGRHVEVPAESIEAVLVALGVDVSDPARALFEQWADRWRRMLPVCLVVRAGASTAFPVHVPHGDPVEVTVRLEDGAERRDLRQLSIWVDPAEVEGALVGEATFALPSDLPLGYHLLHARSGERTASAPLIVTPDRLPEPARAWGFLVQLYSVRSRRSWGFGDLGDLTDLVTWSGGDLGAGLLLVNPLHAPAPTVPREPSPYYPASRRFLDPLYLRVEAIPECADLGAEARATVAALAERARDGSAERVDRDRAWAAKREALALVHRLGRSPQREAAYRAYQEREGPAVRRFATWCALAERHGCDWREWPPPLRRPETASADERAVDFHVWCQWQLDEQLAAVQTAAAAAGMPIGVVHDLAVGVSPYGADAWALQDAMALGVTVGAPPDAFNQRGQDWEQPPWRPDRLAELGYTPFRDMVRELLRHGGGLRVDHVIGLFRLWWVPKGCRPDAGTYVRYDHEALVGVLLLEAARAGAVVVGEDLGVVEPWARDYLRERGVLGTSLLWFERDHDRDVPLRPEQWRELSLGTVTSHDLPTTLSYLRADHVELRELLGALTRPVAEERAAVAAELAQWRRLLCDLGLVGSVASDEDLLVALHSFLARTPARLLGVSLADAVGELRQQNQPGTRDEYPNWRVPLSVTLEDLREHPLLRRVVEAVHRR